MRLIDADALVIYLLKNLAWDKWGIRRMLDSVDDAETIDAVPVVRCKDCEFHRSDDYSNFYDGYWCGYSESFTKPEDYCSRAKKMEEIGNETD